MIQNTLRSRHVLLTKTFIRSLSNCDLTTNSQTWNNWIYKCEAALALSLILILIFWHPRKTPKGWVQSSKSGQMHWTWPWPRISSSDKSSKYFLPPTKRLFLVSPPREEWPFTPFSLSRHSLILLHLVSRRGHMSSPDRETRVLGNKQKTGMFSTFCLHLLFIWGVLGLTQLTRFISRGIIWGSAQQALPSVQPSALSLPLIWRRGSQDFRYLS